MADSHLTDLSGHDSEELMRFNEKRKWFESVLKVLEDLPPIHPFALLVTDGTDECGNDATSAPSPERLDDLQKERDDIEGDVMNFDNGDLVRMKEKTRVITLSPLSRPSTELVSITLDLIVIVDRLLTLLRQRSELIDVCRLRLQWETLRSQCLRDCDRFSDSMEAILADYLDWLPETAHTGVADFTNPSPASSKTPLKESRTVSSPRTPSISATTAKNGGSPGASPNFSLRMKPSPSMNKLRLPLLRSRIESLQIRYHSLAKTTVPRLGAMLDKMIDAAAPLKTNGDADSREHSGAVPEYLLDAQDDLEGKVSGLSSSLAMCRRLERRWTEAESFHDAIVDVRCAAERALVDLKHLSSDPSAIRTSLSAVQATLSNLRDSLPSPIGPYFHDADDPRVVDHDKQIGITLRQTHKDAQTVLDQCSSACDWLQRYLTSKSALSDYCESMSSTRASLGELLDLSEGMEDITADDGEACTSWLARAHIALAEQNPSDLVKLATIELLKHRALEKSRPTSLQSPSDNDVAESVLDRSDTLIDGVTGLVGRLTGRCQTVRRMLELGSTLYDIDQSTNDAHTVLASLQDEITGYIDTALWPSLTNTPEDDGWSSRLARVAHILEVDVRPKLTDTTHQMSNISDNYARRLKQAQNNVDNLQQRSEDVGTLKGLACRVHLQASTVAAVQTEGESLLASILAAQSTRDTTEELRDTVRAWEVDVVARVPFVDIYHSQSGGTAPTDLISGVYLESTTRALLTPPPSPRPTSISRSSLLTRWDLAKTDRAVRTEINNMTSRVRSRLDAGHAATTPADIENEASKPADPPVSIAESNSARISQLDPTPDGIPIGSLRLSSSTNTSASSSRLPTPTRQRASLPRVRVSQSSTSSTLSHTSRSRPPIPFPMPEDRSRSISLGSIRAPLKPQKPRQTPRKYVANDRNQLDRAVGQIINNLPVHVPIAPVGIIEPNEWNDLTGRYWIGTGGRAKLCYCRILRSQTVMVRVGGGWVELSEFLAEHFSETVTTVALPEEPLTPRLPKTPASRNLASEAISQPTSGLTRSTSSGNSLSLGLGLGSPLAPLQFMRKASDSPEDRKKEKNRLKIGRRSILGKEGAVE